jgi:hypothetical protein
MPDPSQFPESDPRHHTAKLRAMLTQAADHAREDVSKVRDPQARALFETTAEVLLGLSKAYEHYEQGTGAAWNKAS